MSATLTWAPVSETSSLPYELRRVLEKKYTFPVTVSYSDVDYFTGLKDAEVEGAQEVLELIELHGEIILDVHY